MSVASPPGAGETAAPSPSPLSPLSPLSPSPVPLAPSVPVRGTTAASQWALAELAGRAPGDVATYWFGFTLRTLRVLSGETVLFDVAERHMDHAAAFAAVTGGRATRRLTRRAQRLEVQWDDPELAAWLRTWQAPAPTGRVRRGPHRALPVTGTQAGGLLAPGRLFTALSAPAQCAFVRGMFDASGTIVRPYGHGAQLTLYGPVSVVRAVREQCAMLWPEASWPAVRGHPTTVEGRGASLAVSGPARIAWFRAWLYRDATWWWEPQRLEVMAVPLAAPAAPKRVGSSPYRGITWDRTRHRWRVRLIRDGVTHGKGFFDGEVEAARAYDDLRVSLGLERVNFPGSKDAAERPSA